MKKLIFLFSVLCLAMTSCSLEDAKPKDLEDPNDIFPVKLDKDLFEKDLGRTFKPGGTLTYEPIFTVEPEEGRYRYNWFLTFKNADDLNERMDLVTDAATPGIDIPVPGSLLEGTYPLYFEIYDPVHDVRTLTSVVISISSSVIGELRGLYILKENGDGNTDIDFYEMQALESYAKIGEDMPAYTVPATPTAYLNVLSSGLGAAVAGKPVDFSYQEGGKFFWQSTPAEAPLNHFKAWMIQTDRTTVTTSGSFQKLFWNFDQMFYPSVQPATSVAQGLTYRDYSLSPVVGDDASIATWLKNNNIIYALAYPVGTPGSPPVKFNTGIMPDGQPMNATHWIPGNNNTMFWDATRKGFFMMTPAMAIAAIDNASLNTAAAKTLFGENQVEVTAMLFGGGEEPVTYSPVQSLSSHVIMKRNDGSAYYLMKWLNQGGHAMIMASFIGDIWVHVIPSDADIVTGTPVMASSFINEVLYYAKNGNELWTYQTSNVEPGGSVPAASLLQTKTAAQIGAGETIVKIMPMTWPQLANYGYHFITVLTETAAGGYKYYVFKNNGLNDEISPAASILTIEGQGKPKTARAQINFVFQ